MLILFQKDLWSTVFFLHWPATQGVAFITISQDINIHIQGRKIKQAIKKVSFVYHVCMHAKLLQLCPTLCNPMDGSQPGSSVHEISQARIVEWVSMASTRASSQPRGWTNIFYISCVGRRVLHQVPPGKPHSMVRDVNNGERYVCVRAEPMGSLCTSNFAVNIQLFLKSRWYKKKYIYIYVYPLWKFLTSKEEYNYLLDPTFSEFLIIIYWGWNTYCEE